MRRTTSRGFTIIELMMVLGIVSIMTTMAISFSGDWRRRYTFDADARHLFQIINLARSEAMRQARTVSVSITPTGQAYAYLDMDKNGEKSSEEPLIIPESPRASLTLSDNRTAGISPVAAQVGTGGTAIAFDMDGLCTDRTGKELAATISVRDPKLTEITYSLDITVAGALRVTKTVR